MRSLKVLCTTNETTDRVDYLMATDDGDRAHIGVQAPRDCGQAIFLTPARCRRLAAWLTAFADKVDGAAPDGPEVV